MCKLQSVSLGLLHLLIRVGRFRFGCSANFTPCRDSFTLADRTRAARIAHQGRCCVFHCEDAHNYTTAEDAQTIKHEKKAAECQKVCAVDHSELSRSPHGAMLERVLTVNCEKAAPVSKKQPVSFRPLLL